MKRQFNQLRAGIILSYINLAIGSIIPFIYTPIMLRILGQEEYGLYSISHSVIGYLSLLNFGLGSTIIRYIAKYRAKNRKEDEKKAFGVFLSIYLVLTVVVIIAGVVLSIISPHFFSEGLSTAEINQLKVLILIMAANTAISFPMSVFTSVIIGNERYFFSRIMDMFLTIAAPCLNLIVLFMGFKSIGMAIASLVIQCVSFPIYITYCYQKLELKPIFKLPEPNFLKEVLGFSFFVFLGSVVDMLFWATDKVILGARVGSTVVAVYNVGVTFNTMIEKLSTSISGVFVPRITGMVALDRDSSELSELFIRIGRIQFYIIGLVVSGFIVFGLPFVELWAGENYRDAYYVALLTIIPLSVPLIQSVGKSIIIAQNKHAFRSIIYLVIAIINVVSTYFIVPYLGGIGAALCSCLSYTVGQGLIMNIFYAKVTRLEISKFWRNIIKMAIVPTIMCVGGLWLSRRVIDLYSLPIFLIGVILYTILYFSLMYRFVMNIYEKNLLMNPVKKILKGRYHG